MTGKTKVAPPAADRSSWSEKMARIRDIKPPERAVTIAIDDDTSETLWFRGLPRPAYESLMAEHPPTPEQKEARQVFDDATFPAALVAACHVDKAPTGDVDDDGNPVFTETGESMTVEEAQELLDSLGQSEAMAVFGAAIAVCTTNRAEIRRA